MRSQEIRAAADKIYQLRPSWVLFYRDVLGIDGIVRRVLTDPEELAKFEKTQDYALIQHMLFSLRAKDCDLPGGPREPERVVTVRMPKSLHCSLRAEAHDRYTSLNKLCIAKLLQPIAAQLVPRTQEHPAAEAIPYKGPQA